MSYGGGIQINSLDSLGSLSDVLGRFCPDKDLGQIVGFDYWKYIHHVQIVPNRYQLAMHPIRKEITRNGLVMVATGDNYSFFFPTEELAVAWLRRLAKMLRKAKMEFKDYSHYGDPYYATSNGIWGQKPLIWEEIIV